MSYMRLLLGGEHKLPESRRQSSTNDDVEAVAQQSEETPISGTIEQYGSPIVPAAQGIEIVDSESVMARASGDAVDSMKDNAPPAIDNDSTSTRDVTHGECEVLAEKTDLTETVSNEDPHSFELVDRDATPTPTVPKMDELHLSDSDAISYHDTHSISSYEMVGDASDVDNAADNTSLAERAREIEYGKSFHTKVLLSEVYLGALGKWKSTAGSLLAAKWPLMKADLVRLSLITSDMVCRIAELEEWEVLYTTLDEMFQRTVRNLILRKICDNKLPLTFASVDTVCVNFLVAPEKSNPNVNCQIRSVKKVFTSSETTLNALASMNDDELEIQECNEIEVQCLDLLKAHVKTYPVAFQQLRQFFGDRPDLFRYAINNEETLRLYLGLFRLNPHLPPDFEANIMGLPVKAASLKFLRASREPGNCRRCYGPSHGWHRCIVGSADTSRNKLTWVRVLYSISPSPSID